MAFGLILTVQTKESGHKASDFFSSPKFFFLMNYQHFLHLMANAQYSPSHNPFPSRVKSDLRTVKS